MCTSSGTATFRKQEEEAVHRGPGATLDMHLLGVGPAGTVLGSALSTLPSGDGLRARGGGALSCPPRWLSALAAWAPSMLPLPGGLSLTQPVPQDGAPTEAGTSRRGPCGT